MNRKAVYLFVAAFSLVIVSALYIPRHTWRAISWDGYNDPDRGVGVAMTTWKLVNDGAIVDESIATYASSEDARKDFREYLKGPGTIIESTKTADDPTGTDERAIKASENAETKAEEVQVIRLRGKNIQIIGAASLKYVLAFERDWLKINF
ncbi:MAG TPA: hypothetical protein VKA60_12605 [Blastocatellia bacterium]|nr:hypothetical protein [Blastocatellia bacterium]